LKPKALTLLIASRKRGEYPDLYPRPLAVLPPLFQQLERLWYKIRRRLPLFLPAGDDNSGILAFSDIPPLPVLEAALKDVKKKHNSNIAAAARERLRKAKEIFSEDFANQGKKCWASVKEPRPSPVTALHVEDQAASPTYLSADPKHLHREVWKAWEPIMRRPPSFSWDAFHKEYAAEISEARNAAYASSASFRLPTAAELHARASSLNPDSATGPDGRATQELRSLPKWIWHYIAHFWETFSSVELRGPRACSSPTSCLFLRLLPRAPERATTYAR
jgi:hypothetical protein